MNQKLIMAPIYPPVDQMTENMIEFNNGVKNKPGTSF